MSANAMVMTLSVVLFSGTIGFSIYFWKKTKDKIVCGMLIAMAIGILLAGYMAYTEVPVVWFHIKTQTH